MNTLAFAEPAFTELEQKLLSITRKETAALVLCEPVKIKNSSWRLIAQDVVVPPPDAYVRRSADHIHLSPSFLAPHFKRAKLSSQSVVFVHTHPLSEVPHPSESDLHGESVMLPHLFRRIPGLPHGRLILGQAGINAALYTNETDVPREMNVVEVGRRLRLKDASEDQVPAETKFDRQVRAFGAEGQKIVRKIRVGIVGVGGTGSVVAQELALLGIRDFLVIDPDFVDESNLNRLVGATPQDVGTPKVDLVARTIAASAPASHIVRVPESTLFTDVLSQLLNVDFIFGCTDTHGSRASLAQFAYQFFVPCIDLGVRIDVSDGRVKRITGRVQMFAPGLMCPLCAKTIDPLQVREDFLEDSERQRDPYIVGSAVPQPAVVSINSTVASLAVTMFLSAVTGIPSESRFQIYMGTSGVVRSIKNSPDPQCILCSQRGALGKGNKWPLQGKIREVL